ncbi:hypothetical protein D3I60_01145 [Brevibacterium permense]|nr:hypothetical protein [Brevibacterium permense]
MRKAVRCCLQKVRRGQFVLTQTCDQQAHAVLQDVHSASSTSYPQVFGDIRDNSEDLKSLIRSYADDRLPDAVFSHVSAALLHDLDPPFPAVDKCEMIRTGTRRSSTTLRIRDRTVPPGDICSVGGLPVTAPIRTLVDIARDYEPEFSVPLLSDALRRRLVSKEELWAALPPAHRGCRTAALAISLADENHESAAESITAVKFHRFDITGMVPQVETFDSAGNFLGRNDFRHEKLELIVECHGVGKYFMGRNNPDEASRKNHERHMKLLNAGYRIFNLVWADLFRPHEFIKIKAELDTLAKNEPDQHGK